MKKNRKYIKNAITVIENAKNYFLLSNDRKSKPMRVGNRIQLEFVLKGVKSDMVIATSGDTKGRRCVVLVDFTSDKCWEMIQNADKQIFKLKVVN